MLEKLDAQLRPIVGESLEVCGAAAGSVLVDSRAAFGGALVIYSGPTPAPVVHPRTPAPRIHPRRADRAAEGRASARLWLAAGAALLGRPRSSSHANDFDLSAVICGHAGLAPNGRLERDALHRACFHHH